MSRLRENFLSGLITDNPLSSSATSINSANFAVLPVVTTPDIMALVLDPYGNGNGPEIVWVTAHSASATVVTVLRGQEDTSGVEHAQNTPWIHGPTAIDWSESETHDHDTLYAPIAHVGSTDGHPVATTSVDGFMDSADKSKLDGIEAGATADPTAADIRSLGFFDISNDGAGSGLDSDKLDGQHGAYFADVTTLGGHKGSSAVTAHPEATPSTRGFMSAADKTKLDGVESGATADQTADEIKAAMLTKDGPDSGLDADLLDGIQGTGYTPIAHVGGTGTAHGNASGSVAGFMTAAQYTKLAGIETAATADQTADEIDTLIGADAGVSGFSLATSGDPIGTVQIYQAWRQSEGTLNAWVHATLGSGVGTGYIYLNLITIPLSNIAKGSSVESGQIIGNGFVVDHSTGLSVPLWIICGASTTARLILSDGSLVSVTNPYTLANLDVFNLWLNFPVIEP